MGSLKQLQGTRFIRVKGNPADSDPVAVIKNNDKEKSIFWPMVLFVYVGHIEASVLNRFITNKV